MFICSWEEARGTSRLVQPDVIDDKFSTYTHVYITNQLHSDLHVHCASKDDDLGSHVVPSNQFYTWRFKINFIESTLFHCSISSGRLSGSYDIYKALRDNYGRCKRKCSWFVREDGIHGYREDGVDDLDFSWQNAEDDLHGN
ncbi:Self-incompatibility protein [Trema orientale]|uniref:S-protein homolog n=1 Tax=Trema orientale TaxID=63057 RepID=A0A2P5G034_TREOI|nr:Self-incompatibility protein [Trema orientale]